jgi:hypothetical protein
VGCVATALLLLELGAPKLLALALSSAKSWTIFRFLRFSLFVVEQMRRLYQVFE